MVRGERFLKITHTVSMIQFYHSDCTALWRFLFSISASIHFSLTRNGSKKDGDDAEAKHPQSLWQSRRECIAPNRRKEHCDYSVVVTGASRNNP